MEPLRKEIFPGAHLTYIRADKFKTGVLSVQLITPLDAATAALDTETEHLIQESIENLIMGRTTIMIAHRLSTVQHADNILVLKDGNIIEHGTHEQLLCAKGFYASLYGAQFVN